MSDSIKLFDLEEKKHPTQRGEIFRSLQVFECHVCGAVTNRVVIGGHPSTGVRAPCPNSSECWHHVVEHKIRWNENPHPREYKAALAKEIDELRAEHRAHVKNDIEGAPDYDKKRPVTNTMSMRPDSKCVHLFASLGIGSFDALIVDEADPKDLPS